MFNEKLQKTLQITRHKFYWNNILHACQKTKQENEKKIHFTLTMYMLVHYALEIKQMPGVKNKKKSILKNKLLTYWAKII